MNARLQYQNIIGKFKFLGWNGKKLTVGMQRCLQCSFLSNPIRIPRMLYTTNILTKLSSTSIIRKNVLMLCTQVESIDNSNANLDSLLQSAIQLIETNGELDEFGEDIDRKQHRASNLIDAKRMLKEAAVRGSSEAQFQLGSFFVHFPNIERELKAPAENKQEVIKEINVIKVNNQRRKKAEKRLRAGQPEQVSGNNKTSVPNADLTTTATAFIALSNAELANMNDDDLALYWLRRAACAGHCKAMCLLANQLIQHSKDKQEIIEAITWYHKASECATDASVLNEILYNLGVVYYEGNEIASLAPNLSKAIAYFQRAADQNDADAHYWLGHFHSSGERLEHLSPQLTIEHFERAYSLGHARAAYRLALLYKNGMHASDYIATQDVSDDAVESAHHCGHHTDSKVAATQKHSCEHHHDHNHHHCHDDHDHDHIHNIHIPNDSSSVSTSFVDIAANNGLYIKYLQKAIEEFEDENAIAELAELKYFGVSGETDGHVEALKLFTWAHSLGHAHASFCIGAMYYSGQAGLQQSAEKAFEYYNIAAERGHIDAWRNLASMYYLGDGVPKSESTAKEIMKTIAKLELQQ